MTRLPHACHLATLLAEHNSKAVVQGRFQGTSPQLDGVPPARLLREGQLNDAAQRSRLPPGLSPSSMTGGP